MGVVYEALQISLNRVVALKVLAPHLSEDFLFRERFRREGQTQAGVDHPNIVTVYEAGESKLGFFIAMRLIRGPNVKDMILYRELDPGRTLRILTPIAGALDTAHASELIHRDIKPQNILVAARDHPFLADFGLTKTSYAESLTKTGQFVGTLDYVSPEQIKGERSTPKSDVYALAAVLYECLTGVVPYPRDNEAAILYAHLADDPPHVSDQCPELPAALDHVVARGMAKNPADRHSSAGELLADARQAFDCKIKEAGTRPGPTEIPQETGIPPADVQVSTREALSGSTRKATAPGSRQTDARRPTGRASTATAVPESADTAAPPALDRTTTPQTTTAAAHTRLPGAERRAHGTRSTAPPALLVGAVLIMAVAVGFLVGHSGGGAKDTSANLVSARSIELGFSEAWQRAPRPLSIRGLDFDDRIDLSPRKTPPGDSLVAGVTQANGRTLLPREFLARLPAPPKQNEGVKLGNLDAYRYKGLRPDGFEGQLTLYVSPTSEGVATLACAASAVDRTGFLSRCERTATTLRLVRGHAFPLGPDKAYEDLLGTTIRRLAEARGAPVRRLRNAKTSEGQATAARAAGGAYARAARFLRRTSPSPAVRGVNASLVARLGRVDAAYRRLATSAHRGSRREYNRGRRDLRRAQAALTRGLRSVEQGG